MSLVNDALKRAQSAQRPILPVPRVEFRPVEPPVPKPNYGLPVLLLAGVALFPLLAFLAVRMALHHGDSSDIQASATAAHVAAAPAVQPPQSTPPPAVPEPQSTPVIAPAAQTPAPAPSVSPVVSVPPTAASQSTHTAPPTEATPPPEPRLQSIIFAQKNPSALINGRVAFVGDKLPEGKVVAISAKSVTLSAGSETIVLTLSE